MLGRGLRNSAEGASQVSALLLEVRVGINPHIKVFLPNKLKLFPYRQTL
jgi:hypothetical protein